MSNNQITDKVVKDVLKAVRVTPRPSDKDVATKLGLKQSAVKSIRLAGSLSDWKRRKAIQRDQAAVSRLASKKLEAAVTGSSARPELVNTKPVKKRHSDAKAPATSVPADDDRAEMITARLLNDTYREAADKHRDTTALVKKMLKSVQAIIDQNEEILGELRLARSRDEREDRVDAELKVPEEFQGEPVPKKARETFRWPFVKGHRG